MFVILRYNAAVFRKEEKNEEEEEDVEDRTLIAPFHENSPLYRSEWHVLTRDHTVLPATDTFIHEWNEPSCLQLNIVFLCRYPVCTALPSLCCLRCLVEFVFHIYVGFCVL